MKNKYYILIFFITILAVSGCTKDPADTNKNENYQMLKPVNDVVDSDSENNLDSTLENVSMGDWQIYQNSEYEYAMKYPADWKVSEVNSFDKLRNKKIQLVIFSDANNKYSLSFGFAKKEDGVIFSNRTGFGAGDFFQTGKILKIGSTEFEKVELRFRDKIKEIYYVKPNSQNSSLENVEFDNYLSRAIFSVNGDLDIDYNENLKDIKELTEAEVILKSFKFIK